MIGKTISAGVVRDGPRRRVWLAGSLILVFPVILLSRDAGSREILIPLSALAIAVTALIAELVAIRSNSRSRSGSPALKDARPADGVVEVVAVAGIEGVLYPFHPSFRKFVRLNSIETPTADLPKMNPSLLGRVVIVSIFVGRDGVAWSETEIANGHKALEVSGIWLEREAIRHGAPLNLALAEVYFALTDAGSEPVEVSFQPEGHDVGPMEVDASTKAIVMASRAALSLGFVDVADWMQQINARIDADAVAWLFHLREAGRSMAIPVDISGISGVGFAVCYGREASFPEPLAGRARVDPTTVAHELLHLFGASDKYGVGLREFPEGSVSSRDIMRLNHASLFRLTIDSLTALEIGWSQR